MELAELSPDEAAEFRSGPSALDDVVLRLKEALGLITFFTVGDTEARSWTLQHGQTALEAAESIHSDIARGFIRCEVIRWDDLLDCGSHAEAARRGLAAARGEDLRRRGRRRPQHPLQRLGGRSVDAARREGREPERGEHDEDRRERPQQALVREVDRDGADRRHDVLPAAVVMIRTAARIAPSRDAPTAPR